MEEGGANVANVAMAAAAEEPRRICVMKSDTRSERDVRRRVGRNSSHFCEIRRLTVGRACLLVRAHALSY